MEVEMLPASHSGRAESDGTRFLWLVWKLASEGPLFGLLTNVSPCWLRGYAGLAPTTKAGNEMDRSRWNLPKITCCILTFRMIDKPSPRMGLPALTPFSRLWVMGRKPWSW